MRVSGSMPCVYLDHNATTPLRAEVREAMEPYLGTQWGNASSLHGWGIAAREGVERARSDLARALGCAADEVFFTGGGTEADNWALKGVVAAARDARPRLVTSAIEHPAVLRVAAFLQRQGCEVIHVPVKPDGCVDPAAVAAAVNPRTVLISVMHANNETGCIQPIAAIGAVAWERRIPFHVDAVQSFGRLPLDVDELNVDLVSLSAHKINGPQGVGALYVRRGMALEPLLHGGAQERGERAGTENVAGIVGFGRAAELRRGEGPALENELRRLRDHLEAGVLAACPGARVNGHAARRVGNTSSISFAGVDSESLVRALNESGIAVASGSACAAEKSEPSHVLLAMGCDRDRADSAIRFSLGWGNEAADVARLLDVLPQVLTRLRAARC